MPAGSFQMDLRSNEADRIVQKQADAMRRSCACAVPFPYRPLTPPRWPAGASRPMKIDTLSIDFTDEQKRYLEGFSTGLQISRVGKGLGGPGAARSEPTGPDAPHLRAQDN